MKRIICLVFAAIMALSLTTPLLASSKNLSHVIATLTDEAFGDIQKNAAVNPEQTTSADEIIVPLLQAGFRDEDGAIVTWSQKYPDLGPTPAQLSNNRVKPAITVTKGGNVIRDVTIVSYTPTRRIRAQAAVRVRFVEDYISTKEQDYEFNLHLKLDGSRSDFYKVFSGLISNPIIEVERDNDTVHLADGSIAYCVRSAQNVRANIGNGVFITTNMIQGERYYGIVNYEPNKKQNAIMTAHPTIECVYVLRTVNYDTAGSIVTIETGDEVYHVYNQRGEYVGDTSKGLPYSTKYYVSKEKINITLDEVTKSEVPVREEEKMSAAVTRFSKGITQ